MEDGQNHETGKSSKDKVTVEELIKCELCKNILDHPKSLVCMHAFCRDCILTYISRSAERDALSVKVLTCPVCLQKTNAPKSAVSVEEWADNLPTDDFLCGYLEALSLKDPHKACDTCKRQSKNVEAQQWCKLCHDALCDDCVSFHNSLKTTTQHKLEYLSKLRNQPIENIISAPHCSIHEGNIISRYCENHSRVVCDKCVVENHKSCKDVKPTKDSATQHQSEISVITTLLNEETNVARKIYDDRMKASAILDDEEANVLHNIQSVRKRLNDNLIKLETQIIGELYDIHGKEKSIVQDETKEAQRIRKSAGKVFRLVESAGKYGSYSHKLQLMQNAELQSSHYKGKIGSLNNRIKNTHIQFVINDALEHVITGINRLGELKVNSSFASVPISNTLRVSKDDSDPEDELDIKSSRLTLKSINRSLKSNPVFTQASCANIIAKISFRTATDMETCWFTGIAYLPNGMIILVDRNNSKLKMLNNEFKLVFELLLDNQPFDITTMSDSQVAVTIPRENRINIFNIGTVLTLSESLETSDRCYGICFCANKFLVACACGSPPSIKVISRNGEETLDICPQDNYQPMFLRPWYVKGENTGHTMYVSDCHRSHVTSISGTIMKKFVFKDSTLNSPRGICVTKDKRLIVCGFGSDNVQLVDAQGNRVGDILLRSDDVLGPQNVAVNQAEDKMIVTFDPSCGNSDFVHIYQLTI